MSDAAAPFGWLRSHEEQRRADGLRRTLRSRSADETSAGYAPLDLASNDYLGLSRDPRVVEAAVEALRVWGAGATGSRLVTGTTTAHTELEDALAAFVGTEAALVFSSGYLANLGAVAALTGRSGDASARSALVVSDAVNHASIVDACRLSRSRVEVVPHRDVRAVDRALSGSATAGARALVVTDGVFSVDGDTAPLTELREVCRAHGAALLVDDAHALGVVGPGGRGTVAAAGLAGDTDVLVTVTLSKSLGAQGGAVLGSRAVVDHLVDTARPFIFDTGLAPAAVGAARTALDVLSAEPTLAARTRARARDLAAAARAAGLQVAPPEAAVVSVTMASPQAAVEAQVLCRSLGVEVGCFRPPSVPDGVSRLRLTARADLTDDDVSRAAAALVAVAQRGLGAAA